MQKKIILVGETVLDRNHIVEMGGKAAEYNSPKAILLKTELSLGGAGMVYSALKQTDRKVDFFSISNKKLKHKLSLSDRKNISFDANYKLEKNRYWAKKNMILQINDIKKTKKILKKFQNSLIKKACNLKNGNIVIFSDYRNGIFGNEFTKKIIKILKSKNSEILLDQQSTTKEPDLLKFKGVDFLFLNKEELLKSLKKYKIKNTNLKKGIIALHNKIGINKIIVKMGHNGCLYSDKEKFLKSRSFKPLKKANTIGAGDFFLAKFASLNISDIKNRLSQSNKFAYLKIIGKLKNEKIII